MYKKIWFKFHLYLGLIAAVILFTVAITGAILSFQKEIIQFINKNSFIVNPLENKLSQKEILVRFQEKLPNEKIRALTVFSDKKSSYIINVAIKGAKGKAAFKGKNYYINPYTVEILPDILGEKSFKTIELIHRGLIAGKVGKQIVGASVVCLLILIVTGIIIYWDRLKKAFIKSLTFSFKSKGRKLLSTMHSSVGMWIIPFLLLASITGLTWSYSFVKDSLYFIAGVEKVQRKPLKRDIGDDKKDLKLPLDEIQKTFDIFEENISNYKWANLRFENKNGIYNISYLKNDAIHFRARNQVQIDSTNKKIIKHEQFSTLPLNEKLIKSIYPLHAGEYFGVIGQVLMFLSSLALAILCVTGVLMYIKRKF
ncbi:PepSY-associated TM helix domain-containing protein [Arcobacter arenosus]|uniref:PepSY-associated TM helix domain-containing protein n=1 Tax=Arcobacter arenosus TaxID=2576037 RepID=UPI003BAB870D